MRKMSQNWPQIHDFAMEMTMFCGTRELAFCGYLHREFLNHVP